MSYRYGGATYRIAVDNPHRVSHGVTRIELDGAVADGHLRLVDDGRTHEVRVTLGQTEAEQRSPESIRFGAL